MNVTPAALSALAKGDLENFLVASQPGGIEAQEAQGQRDLVSSFDRLPARMSEKERELATKLGFVIGEPIDTVFVSVTAPEGWTLRPTEHSMHSDILDANGVVRGGMFYKAAFYDRRATVSWNSRYTMQEKYGEGTITYSAIDTKTNEMVIEPVTLNEPPYPVDHNYTAYDEVRAANSKVYAKMVADLEARFPDYRDPAAYWND
jgi:hypothetical protein